MSPPVFAIKRVDSQVDFGFDSILINLNKSFELGTRLTVGRILGTVAVGSMSATDQFTSTSARLTALGIGTSHQEITAPNTTQVVPGIDGKLGAYYNYHGENIPELTLEIGYRIAAYLNGISTISPNTLVQPGTFRATPEFATGTMAIVSTDGRSRPFNLNGPYLNLKIVMA